MSQSGIPVVSQVASVVGNVANGVGDIFSGKNVFESLGRIIVAPVAGALDLANDLSFNTLANTKFAGVNNIFEGGKELNDNPYSADAAIKLGKGIGTASAVAAGGLAGAGIITGVGATGIASASTLSTLGGVSLASNSAANRNIEGVIGGLATIGAANGVDVPKVPDAVSSAYNAVRPLTSFGGSSGVSGIAPPTYTNNSVNGAAQTALLGLNSTDVILLGIAGIAVYYLARHA